MVLPTVLQTADLVLRANQYSGVGNWIDESPNAFEAQLFGDIGWNGSRFSLAPGAYMQIADTSILEWAASSDGAIYVICRVKPNTTPMTIVKKRTGQGGSGGTGWEIYETTALDFEFEMQDHLAAVAFRTVPDLGGASQISISRQAGGFAMRRNFPFNEDDEANSSTADGSSANAEPFLIGNPSNDGELEIWGVAFWNDEQPTGGDPHEALVESTVFDPEVHHNAVMALRASAYQGVKETISDSAMEDETQQGNDADPPSVELAKTMWDSAEQAMKLREEGHYWDITPAVVSTLGHGGAARISDFLLHHGMVVGRLISGTENSKMAMVRIADPASEVAYIALGVDASQPWFRIDDGNGNQIDIVLPSIIPLNTKFAIGWVRESDGPTHLYWINREEVQTLASDSLTGFMNWTEANVRFRLGKASGGAGLIPGDAFVGDVFGFAYGWGRTATLTELTRQTAWVDAGSFEGNVQVIASLRESAWAAGGLRS